MIRTNRSAHLNRELLGLAALQSRRSATAISSSEATAILQAVGPSGSTSCSVPGL